MVNIFFSKGYEQVFRGKFIALLKERVPAEITSQQINELYIKEWNCVRQTTLNGPQSVIEYLGRYTHICPAPVAGKIAISNHRIKNVTESTVNFSYKDYKQGAVKNEMTLDARLPELKK